MQEPKVDWWKAAAAYLWPIARGCGTAFLPLCWLVLLPHDHPGITWVWAVCLALAILSTGLVVFRMKAAPDRTAFLLALGELLICLLVLTLLIRN